MLGACSSGRGEALLRAGRPAEVLQRVRPKGAAAYRLRARALRALGRLRDAQTELRISLALEPRSVEGHRLLGYVEARLGNRGAALTHLSRSLALDAEQPAVARAVARLLVRRALLRVDPAVGLGQRRAARRELARARKLDPSLPEVGQLLGRRSKLPRGGPADCPGVPPSLGEVAASPAPRSGGGRCPLALADRHLRRLEQRYLLLGCAGVQLARFFERHRCLDQAQAVWRALQAETPTDPRWVREAARLALGAGEAKRAQQLLTDYVYLAADRGAAQLDAARMLLGAGRAREGAGRAVEALALASRPAGLVAVVRLLASAGLGREASAAARYIERLRPRIAVPAAVLERALNGGRDAVSRDAVSRDAAMPSPARRTPGR